MRAAVYYGKHDVRLENVPDPAPGPGELLIKVAAVGICGTDADEYAHGPRQFPVGPEPHPVTGHSGPLIPGHEPSGEVVALGAGVTGFTAGDLVASGATTPCGTCEACRQGRGTICASISAVGVQRHGALAEYAAVPAVTCRRLDPYGIGADTGALAQPMAIAVHAIRRGRLQAGEHALIVGAGGVGAFACYIAATAGAQVSVFERAPQRLQLARQLGATTTVDVREAGHPETVLAQLNPDPVDVAYELTGTASGLRSALAAVRPGGRMVQVGLHHEPPPIDLFRLTIKELEIIGTNSLLLYPDLHVALSLLSRREEGWSAVAPRVIPLADLVTEGLEPLAARTAAQAKTLVGPGLDRARPIRG